MDKEVFEKGLNIIATVVCVIIVVLVTLAFLIGRYAFN